MRSPNDGWVTLDGGSGKVPAPPPANEPEATITNPMLVEELAPVRMEFQRRRALTLHAGLMKAFGRYIDELIAIRDRIENNDVKDADYNALAQAVAGGTWIAMEASAMDRARDVSRALEGRKP